MICRSDMLQKKMQLGESYSPSVNRLLAGLLMSEHLKPVCFTVLKSTLNIVAFTLLHVLALDWVELVWQCSNNLKYWCVMPHLSFWPLRIPWPFLGK